MKTVIAALAALCLGLAWTTGSAQGGNAPAGPTATGTVASAHAARVRTFQSAQASAGSGDIEAAIATARQALAEAEDFSVFPLRWNDFVLAHIAYWQGDRDALVTHRNRVAEGTELVANEMNARQLDTLMARLPDGTAVAGSEGAEFPVPDPPAGYSWLFVPGTSTAVLRPDGWYATVEEDDGQIAAFVSLENWEERGEFETGLSFNFIPDMRARSGTTAQAYGESIIAGAANSFEVLIAPQRGELGPGLVFMGVRVRAVLDDTPVIIHSQVIVDNDRDSVRLVVFESPEATWDEMWEIGRQLLRLEIRR